jgi:hypothetical protein
VSAKVATIGAIAMAGALILRAMLEILEKVILK